MSKEIVSKEQIAVDPNLTLIKAFRISNKRAGEAKREQNRTAFEEYVGKLRFLSIDANSRGFKIWVNDNGKTGHTYTKDYKLTDDADNNWELHEARLAERAELAERMIQAAITQHQNEPESFSAAPLPLEGLDETGMDDIVPGLDSGEQN